MWGRKYHQTQLPFPSCSSPAFFFSFFSFFIEEMESLSRSSQVGKEKARIFGQNSRKAKGTDEGNRKNRVKGNSRKPDKDIILAHTHTQNSTLQK